MPTILSHYLAVAVTDWAAQFQLASVAGVQVGHLCAIESELAQVMGVGPARSVTVRRGVEGTAAAAHAAGTPVAVYSAGDVTTDAVASSTATLSHATVTLTDAQIKTLPTLGVAIVPAPGLNRVIVPVCGTAVTAFGGGAYSNVSTEAVWAFYLVETFASAMARADTVLGSTTTFIVPIGGTHRSTTDAGALALETYSAVAWDANVLNTPLLFADFFASASNYTGGHATNTLRVTVLYGVLDLTTGWV